MVLVFKVASERFSISAYLEILGGIRLVLLQMTCGLTGAAIAELNGGTLELGFTESSNRAEERFSKFTSTRFLQTSVLGWYNSKRQRAACWYWPFCQQSLLAWCHPNNCRLKQGSVFLNFSAVILPDYLNLYLASMIVQYMTGERFNSKILYSVALWSWILSCKGWLNPFSKSTTLLPECPNPTNTIGPHLGKLTQNNKLKSKMSDPVSTSTK